jgi:hypothetical protein
MISSVVESALQSFINFFVRKAEKIKDIVYILNNADENFYYTNANNDNRKGNGKEFLSISTIYIKLIAKKYSNTFNLCTQGCKGR